MTTAAQPGPSPQLNRTQVKALVAAFLGWMFDGLDGYLYVMVAAKFVGQLLGKAPSDPETLEKATIIQCVFLIGWAVGGRGVRTDRRQARARPHAHAHRAHLRHLHRRLVLRH